MKVGIVTQSTPVVKENEGISGWGHDAVLTQIEGNVEVIEINLNDKIRFSLRIQGNKITLTSYGEGPLWQMMPSNLTLYSDRGK